MRELSIRTQLLPSPVPSLLGLTGLFPSRRCIAADAFQPTWESLHIAGELPTPPKPLPSHAAAYAAAAGASSNGGAGEKNEALEGTIRLGADGTPLFDPIQGVPLRGPIEEEAVSVFPSYSTPEGSFLNVRWGPKPAPERERRGESRERRRSTGGLKKSGVVDKPVTFNKKVKSSGYGEAPTPTWRGKSGPFQDKSVNKRGETSRRPSNGGRLLREYPVTCGPLSVPQENNLPPP